MALDMDSCIRNHVLGVLSVYCEKGFQETRLSQLADCVTKAAIEGARKWHEDNNNEIYEDMPQ